MNDLGMKNTFCSSQLLDQQRNARSWAVCHWGVGGKKVAFGRVRKTRGGGEESMGVMSAGEN